MTVRYPKATWRPLPEADQQPALTPVQGILHTVVGHGSPWNTFNAPGNGDESHLWLSMDGQWEQFVSFDRTADANAGANHRALSVETEDDGPATVEDTPWTDKQVAELANFVAWCNDPEGLVASYLAVTGVVIAPIPIQLCASPTSPGWGWHAMWPKPNPWTIYQGKTCPGRTRTAQVPTIIDIARSLRTTAPVHLPEEDDMPETYSRPKAYNNIFREPSGFPASSLPAGHGPEADDVFDHPGRLAALAWRNWGKTVAEAEQAGLLEKRGG